MNVDLIVVKHFFVGSKKPANLPVSDSFYTAQFWVCDKVNDDK
jgi:hypothetical protein